MKNTEVFFVLCVAGVHVCFFLEQLHLFSCLAIICVWIHDASTCNVMYVHKHLTTAYQVLECVLLTIAMKEHNNLLVQIYLLSLTFGSVCL